MKNAPPNVPRKLILVVEDEIDLAEMVRYNLEHENYECNCLYEGRGVLQHVLERRPDLILLDRMLPGLSGDEIVAQLKQHPAASSIPVIMLTAKVAESDQIVGFTLGADDYVCKPFSMKVLLARVAALLRRTDSDSPAETTLQAGPVILDLTRCEAAVNGQPITLTTTEFRLLTVLLKSGGRVLDRGRLIDAAMGANTVVTDRTIDVHITAIRKKLGDAGAWIQTIRGFGYTFRDPSEANPRKA